MITTYGSLLVTQLQHNPRL